MPPPADAADTVLEATGARARVARVYAEALMAVARQAGQVDAVADELAAVVRDVLAARPHVEDYLSSGAVGRKAKLQALEAGLGAGGASDALRKFLGVLAQNNRLGLLRPVAAAFQRLRDEAAGRVRVRVTSAAPLSDSQTEALRRTLADKLKAEPVLDARTDPALLGGLVVRVGDTVYDTSVRTRLQTLRTHLLASATNVPHQR